MSSIVLAALESLLGKRVFEQSQVGATSAAKQSASPRFAMPPGDFVKRVSLAHGARLVSLAHGARLVSLESIQKKSRSSAPRCSLLSKL